MADLRANFVGIKSPNPFWLASAPPTDKEYNVVRAFRAGWGGVVWKTLGEEGPPVVNVNGPRYGAIHGPDRRLMGLNNIELITDRPLEALPVDGPIVQERVIHVVSDSLSGAAQILDENGAMIDIRFGSARVVILTSVQVSCPWPVTTLS